MQNFWWGAAFLINVPVMLITFPIAWKVLPRSGTRTRAPLDVAGMVLAMAGVLMLVLGIKEAGYEGVLSPVAVISAPTAVVLLVGFVIWERRYPTPHLDVRIFARWEFRNAVLSVLAVLISLTGIELFLAQYFQLVLGNTPFAAGLRMLPLMIATIIGSLLAGAPLFNRFGTHAVTAGGLAFAAAAQVPLLWLDVNDRPWLSIFAFLGLGLGSSAALTAASNSLMDST